MLIVPMYLHRQFRIAAVRGIEGDGDRAKMISISALVFAKADDTKFFGTPAWIDRDFKIFGAVDREEVFVVESVTSSTQSAGAVRATCPALR